LKKHSQDIKNGGGVMGNFNDFIERMKREKDGFAEVWESNRPRREFISHIEEIGSKRA
jgi:hypothetical protein